MFGADTVEFAGFGITPSNVRPCKKYLDAIHVFPTPANITDVSSWFALINQVSYAFAATERLLPSCQLLQPRTPFKWTDKLNRLFEESKSVITSEIEEGVHIFDKSKPTCLATNWSKRHWIPENTASVHPPNPSAVAQTGKSHWSAAALLTLLNHVMPQWREKPWSLQMPLIKLDSLSWDAAT